MTIQDKQKIFDDFCQYVSPERAEKIIKNSAERTRYVTIVLEDIYQGHNASAALRTSDCFGIQDVHIIEQKHSYKLAENVAKGASDWLDIKRYNDKNANNTQVCFDALRAQGYKIVATSPWKNDVLLHELPVDTKTALVFGTEQYGLSEYALQNADAFVKVPMYGFTESFNISVSVALCLYDITQRIRENNMQWQLTPEERIDLQLYWLGRTTRRYGQIEALLTGKTTS